MEVLHKKTGTHGMFYVENQNELVAEMVYSMSNNRLIIEHTEVSDELRGKNIGLELLKASGEYARQNALKIIPVCPFAKAIFDKKPEFSDVLD